MHNWYEFKCFGLGSLDNLLKRPRMPAHQPGLYLGRQVNINRYMQDGGAYGKIFHYSWKTTTELPTHTHIHTYYLHACIGECTAYLSSIHAHTLTY